MHVAFRNVFREKIEYVHKASPDSAHFPSSRWPLFVERRGETVRVEESSAIVPSLPLFSLSS